ncbi:unnamed protein product [Cochlearia groenlandica]
MEVIRKVKNTIVPNLYLHNAIITGYCTAGRLDEAYNHLESMQKEGIVPNQVTFTVLMKSHIEAGEIESAIDLFEESKCEPDQVMYCTLLKGLCESERPDDALALMLEMQKNKICPNKETYEKLLQCMCNSRLTMEAVKPGDALALVPLLRYAKTYEWPKLAKGNPIACKKPKKSSSSSPPVLQSSSPPVLQSDVVPDGIYFVDCNLENHQEIVRKIVDGHEENAIYSGGGVAVVVGYNAFSRESWRFSDGRKT